MSASTRHLGRRAVCLIAAAHALAFGAAAHAETPAAGAPSVGAPAQQQAGSAVGQTPAITLSNDRTSTTWANALVEADIRASPHPRSHAIARTHLLTEDGFPEVYLLLSSYTDPQGREWIRLRVPGRPNGRVGWVSRGALGEYHLTHWLLDVRLREHRLEALYEGHLRFTAPVGVGKPSTPTPSGHFWIRERFRLTSRSNPYWPWALGTSDYSTLSEWPGGGVIGIHGDFGEPSAIPGNPSHGCIRMRDRDIAWLAPRIQVGTPVDVIG